MPKLNRTDGSIYYELIAAGPEALKDATPFIIIPGIGLSGRFYRDFAEAVATTAPVILPDHRRTGKSTVRLPWGYTIADIGEDLIAIADQVGFKTFHLVGESYGGMVAMSIAVDYPERVQSLCVINSSFAGSRYPRLKAKALITTIRGLTNPLRWHAGIERHIFSPLTHKNNPTIIKKWAEMVLSEGMPLITTQKQSLAALKFHPKKKLRGLKIPTMVVYGTDDLLVPNRNSHIIKEAIPNAKIHEVVGGGHHLCGEQPLQIAPIILKFVKEL